MFRDPFLILNILLLQLAFPDDIRQLPDKSLALIYSQLIRRQITFHPPNHVLIALLVKIDVFLLGPQILNFISQNLSQVFHASLFVHHSLEIFVILVDLELKVRKVAEYLELLDFFSHQMNVAFVGVVRLSYVL